MANGTTPSRRIPINPVARLFRDEPLARPEEAQEMLNWIKQMTRRLVGIRLATLHETTAHEEQRA
jgi:hypothetical protein